MSIATDLERDGLPPDLTGSADLLRIPYRDLPRRSVAQRWGLAMPRAYDAAARTVRALPLGAARRRSMFARALAETLAAYNRRDWQALLLNIAEDVEVRPPAGAVALGLAPSYHGHEGYVEYQEAWIDVWGDFNVIPALAIDLGRRMVVLGRMGGEQVRMRITTDSEFGSLDTYSGAKLARQEIFLSHAEAMGAAGIRPPAPPA